MNPKGRTSIPATTRRETEIEETVLVAHVEGPGRIVIKTCEAVNKSIWALFPATQVADASAGVRSLRVGDRELSDARFAERGHAEPDLAALEALVAKLGL